MESMSSVIENVPISGSAEGLKFTSQLLYERPRATPDNWDSHQEGTSLYFNYWWEDTIDTILSTNLIAIQILMLESEVTRQTVKGKAKHIHSQVLMLQYAFSPLDVTRSSTLDLYPLSNAMSQGCVLFFFSNLSPSQFHLPKLPSVIIGSVMWRRCYSRIQTDAGQLTANDNNINNMASAASAASCDTSDEGRAKVYFGGGGSNNTGLHWGTDISAFKWARTRRRTSKCQQARAGCFQRTTKCDCRFVKKEKSRITRSPFAVCVSVRCLLCCVGVCCCFSRCSPPA